MSISMPLSQNGQRKETGNVTPLRPDTCGTRVAGPPPEERIDHLEARLERLESGQVTALDLVRQALAALSEAQTRQNAGQAEATARLSNRLEECEASLARLDARQRHDDETMRERLFDMSEMLESVRATAASAVRPAALRKFERALGQEMDDRASDLRAELGDQFTRKIEAAENRSVEALHSLEECFWDDMTEIARRFDYLADSFRETCRSMDALSYEETAPDCEWLSDMPSSSPDAEEVFAPVPENKIEPLHGSEKLQSVADTPPSGVIPFPPHLSRQADTEIVELPDDIGKILSPKARRAGEAEAEEADEREPHDASHPSGFFGRLAAGAGSTVRALAVMTALSLLTGPVLGPGLQGTAPAFADERAAWTPVELEPLPVRVSPRLTPVVDTASKTGPVIGVNAPTSDR